MPAVDGNAGSAVTVGGTRGVFLRPLAIALAATVLMGAAPVAAQIAIPIPNFRFVVPHQGGGVYHHHRAYHIRGIQKPGDTGPNAPTVPPAQNGGPSPGGAAPVPTPATQAPSSPAPAVTPTPARGGDDFEPAK